MLILPPGHWQEVTRSRERRPRDRWLIGLALGLLAAVAVVLTISVFSTGPTSRDGCVDVTAATATGAFELNQCGAQARALCARPTQAGPPTRAFVQAIVSECRKAGLPVGP
ncbi:MAG: hypothetical protein ACLP50_21095 [Solirubrobacteraceae bacterium]